MEDSMDNRSTVVAMDLPLVEALEGRLLASASTPPVFGGLQATAPTANSIDARPGVNRKRWQHREHGSAVTALTPAPPPAVTPPKSRTWGVVFDDEFAGTSLASPWQTHQYWNNSVTVVGNGELEAYTP